MNKKKTIIIATILGLVLVLVGAFALRKGLNFTALKTLCVWRVVISPKKDPEMYKTPVPLTYTNVSSIVSMSFTNIAYSFSTPWSGSEVLADTNVVIYSYTNGVKIFVGLDDSPFAVGLNQFKKSTDKEKYQIVETLLESADIKSLFDLFDSIVNSSPNDLSASLSKEDALVKNFLLTMKIVTGAPEYSFTYGEGNGFQLCEPIEDSHAQLILFDTPNSSRQIDIVWGDDCDVVQEDLNCIIQSLKKCEPVVRGYRENVD